MEHWGAGFFVSQQVKLEHWDLGQLHCFDYFLAFCHSLAHGVRSNWMLLSSHLHHDAAHLDTVRGRAGELASGGMEGYQGSEEVSA